MDFTLLEGKSWRDKMDGTACEGVENSEGGVHPDGRWAKEKEGSWTWNQGREGTRGGVARGGDLRGALFSLKKILGS